MTDVTLQIKPRNGHRNSRTRAAEIHKLPATIRVRDRVRVQLEVPASSVEVVSGRNGDLVYRFEVELEMKGKFKNSFEATFEKVEADDDSDARPGPSGP